MCRGGGASRPASVHQMDRSIAVTEATFTTAIKPMAAPASGKGGLSRNQSGSVGWCENLLMRRDIGVPSRLATSRHPSTLHWLCLRVCVLEHSLRLSAKLKGPFGSDINGRIPRRRPLSFSRHPWLRLRTAPSVPFLRRRSTVRAGSKRRTLVPGPLTSRPSRPFRPGSYNRSPNAALTS